MFNSRTACSQRNKTSLKEQYLLSLSKGHSSSHFLQYMRKRSEVCFVGSRVSDWTDLKALLVLWFERSRGRLWLVEILASDWLMIMTTKCTYKFSKIIVPYIILPSILIVQKTLWIKFNKIFFWNKKISEEKFPNCFHSYIRWCDSWWWKFHSETGERLVQITYSPVINDVSHRILCKTCLLKII